MMRGALAVGATMQLLWGISVGGSPPNMKGRVYPGISNGLPGAKLEHRCAPHPALSPCASVFASSLPGCLFSVFV